MLHPACGYYIEVEDEVHRVLREIEESILGFGPDTGHLTWAGMDPTHYEPSRRSYWCHAPKDVHADQVSASRGRRCELSGVNPRKFYRLTEPGRGDVDLPGALATLPESFRGWIVVEVDVPEAETNLASTQISAEWITAKHIGSTAFNASR